MFDYGSVELKGGLMKIVWLVFTISFVSLSAFADSVGCSDSILTPGGYVTGNCNNGHCSATHFSQSLSASGVCRGGAVSFQARAYTPTEYISGACMSGSFSAFRPSQYLNWNGACSPRGSFSGQSSMNGGYVNGACVENGSFSIYIPGTRVSVNGYCTF